MKIHLLCAVERLRITLKVIFAGTKVSHFHVNKSRGKEYSSSDIHVCLVNSWANNLDI